jgi:hypothetical protein
VNDSLAIEAGRLTEALARHISKLESERDAARASLHLLAHACGLVSNKQLAEPAAALSTYIQKLQLALERIASLPRGEHGNCRFCDTNGWHADHCPRGIALTALLKDSK